MDGTEDKPADGEKQNVTERHSSNDQASFISETESSVANEQSIDDKAHPISTSHKRDHGAASKTTEENTKTENQGCNVTNPEESHLPSGLQENKTGAPHSFNVKSTLEKKVLVDHIKGVIYGNCIGDAIGLLTEFMSKSEAAHIYGVKSNSSLKDKLKDLVTKEKKKPQLEYDMKNHDFHRSRWETGDWTDDSDQMILILLSLLDNNGKMEPVDFAKKMRIWSRKGFAELGDMGGMGIGRTTYNVLHHPYFLSDPHQAAKYVWEESGRYVAPNGGVMRTSILGIHDFGNIEEVLKNTKVACKVTHADPRCIASCVATTTAIAMMLQGKYFEKELNCFDVEAIIQEAYSYASATLETVEQEEELKRHMFAKSLDDLQLDEAGKIGYTYKCLGAGFWSLRQNDFRTAIEAIAFEAGDADTNGAVAGALLGCKLGASELPDSWRDGLKHKGWLDGHISKFLALLGLND